MIKLIVFDFDGVILDSTEEKLMHFAEEMKAFNKSPEEARKAMLDSFGQPFNPGMKKAKRRVFEINCLGKNKEFHMMTILQ